MLLPSFPVRAVDQQQIMSCPQSYAPIQLGIQNVVPEQQQGRWQTGREGLLKNNRKDNPSSCLANFQMEVSKGQQQGVVQATIYQPSQQSTPAVASSPSSDQEDVLILKVSTDPQGNDGIARARLPLLDIPSFPISVTLTVPDDHGNDSTLYVSSQIVGGMAAGFSSSIATTNDNRGGTTSSPKCFGQGSARMLQLPSGLESGDFVSIRAAATIRISPPNAPDRLFTW